MPVSLAELVEHGRVLIVRPIVIIDDALLRQRRRRDQKDDRKTRKAAGNAAGNVGVYSVPHVSVGSPAAFHAKIPPARWLP